MPHDPLFEQRIADALKAQGVKPEHKKMFGGVAFMVHGNMCVGITNKGDLLVRVATERYDEMLRLPGAKPMRMGTRTMHGFLFVDADAVATKPALDKWIMRSLAYVNGLPKKAAKSAAEKTLPKKEKKENYGSLRSARDRNPKGKKPV